MFVKVLRACSLLVFLVVLLTVSVVDGFAARKQRKSDNRHITEILDSLVTSRYFSGAQNRYPPTFIPYFDDQTYAERIAWLNSKTSLKLVYNEHVKNYIRLYSVNKRKLTAKVLGLTRVYFPLFEQKLRQYNIPTELKYLAIVESALNPSAVSPANAKGLWQFIYGTGKMYDLESSAFVEDRFDPEKATIAACRHMRDLYNIYGDWFLVLAAYNCGAGNVNKAIRRSGGARDYWAIWEHLPRETRGYVPAYIAVTYIMNYYHEHNILPIEPGYLYENIGAVRVSRVVAFDQISEVVGVPESDLKYLNPHFKLNLVPASENKPYYIRLPRRYLEDFVVREYEIYAHKSRRGIEGAELLAKAREVKKEVSEKQKSIHVVRKGETIASIAKMYRCYVSQIIQWNNLRNSRIYPGQKLKVFGDQGSAKRRSAKASSLVQHKVRRGESLGLIAKKYGVSVSKISSWNKLGRRGTIYPGQKLKIYGKGAPASSRAKNHKVRKGETLGHIARKHGVTVRKLMSWNDLGRKRTIYPGQQLKLYPPTKYHRVKKGESLDRIARKYGVTVRQLASWNSLGRKRTIYPGQKLKIKTQ